MKELEELQKYRLAGESDYLKNQDHKDNTFPSDKDERWLRAKCYQVEGPYLQPFSPNIKWREARIFIVGLNPVIPLRYEFQSFDHYWDCLTNYPEQYNLICESKYSKKEEQKSRTKRRIFQLVENLKPINVLITNTFAYPSINPLNIPKSFRNEPISERIVSRLISICKPKAILFHGREAIDFANKYFKVSLNPYVEPVEQSVKSQVPNVSASCRLFAYHHFVGRVNKGDVVDKHIRELAGQLRLCVEQTRPD
jgi:hypothetical protein